MARAPPPSQSSKHLELSDDEEISNAESYHSRRSHSTTNTGGGNSRHNSSTCINIYSSQNDKDVLDAGFGGGNAAAGTDSTTHHESRGGSQSNVRRSASGVFRYPPNEDDENQFGDRLYLLEDGCHHHSNVMPDYADEDELYRSPKMDPFDGRLQKQMKVMNKNLSTKLEELQGFPALDTNVALTEIRSQLHELTKSVESCHSGVFEVKQDMMTVKSEIDSVQFVKEEIDDIRDSLEKLETKGDVPCCKFSSQCGGRCKASLSDRGLTFCLGYSIFAAVLGMLQFGYNTGVINAPETVIEKFIRFAYRQRYAGQNMTYKGSTFLYAIAVAVFALGGMCGGFFGMWFANKLGRKGGLLVNNVVGMLGAAAMGLSKLSESYELLIMGRYLIGVNCGLNTSLVPMYISEIAPLTLRGGLGTINQLAVTVGLLLSQILGVEGILGTDDRWPILLGLAVFPPVLQLLLLPFCPESPRYLLITRQREQDARAALKCLRNSGDVENDIDEMRAEEMAEKAEARLSTFELLRSPTLRSPLVIAVVMQLSQQLSGINAVFYYSTNLFITTGLTESHAKYATIGIGIVMVIMTLMSIPLMEKSGRRTLHLYGLGGMFIFSIFITISFLVKELVAWVWWLSVVSTLFYVVFFAVGPGSIPWMITAELFSQGPRPAAMSVAVVVNWCANFLVAIGFPTMQTSLANYTFLPFSVFLAIFWCFTYRKVPETKNKSFDEVATLFRMGRKQRSLMNCVNSMSQLTSCEHSSLLPPHEKKMGAPAPGAGGSEKDEGFEGSTKDYPLLPDDSCPPTPRSRSPQSLRSPSPMSEYSARRGHGGRGSPDRLDEDMSDNSRDESSGSPPPTAVTSHCTHSRHSSAGHLHPDDVIDCGLHAIQGANGLEDQPSVFLSPHPGYHGRSPTCPPHNVA